MQPKPGQLIADPACGTGGFLLATHDYIAQNHQLDKADKKHLKTQALHGIDIVPSVVSLCAMNLYLHGIGSAKGKPPLTQATPHPSHPSPKPTPSPKPLPTRSTWSSPIPPFGKKGGFTIVGDDGKISTEKHSYERDDFWATTSNKQLNFLQHIVSMLAINGSAAVVLPDNILFEGGAGETIRRNLLQRCDVHTLLRPPTGIFYAQGVKANVLFFDRKPASEKPWTKELWIYDLRTSQHFTLKTNPLKESDLEDFKKCYKPKKRQETERFKRFTYEALIARDYQANSDMTTRAQANLDILWLKDDSLEDSENLPAPAILAAEIVESLQTALEEFRGVEDGLTTDK